MHCLAILLVLVHRALCSKESWSHTQVQQSSSIAGNGRFYSVVASTTTNTRTQTISSTCYFPTSVPEPGAEIFNVMVGARGDLRFDPETIKAKIGDIVNFEFLARNHTLTQSSFSHPCQNQGGFSTGFNQFNPKSESGKFIIRYRIGTLDPQWFFCAQSQPKSHCQAGMVFAVNGGDKMNDFVSAAQLTSEGMILSSQVSSLGPTKLETTRSSAIINDANTRYSLPLTSPTPSYPTPPLASQGRKTTVQPPGTTGTSPPVSTAVRYRLGGFTLLITYLVTILFFL